MFPHMTAAQLVGVAQALRDAVRVHAGAPSTAGVQTREASRSWPAA
jgi:hypothetical protein